MGGFNGSGTFVRSYSWTTDAANGIKIRSDRMDTEDNGFATGLTDCVTRDGQSPALADLPMSNFRHLGVGNANARNQYGVVGQLQDGTYDFAILTGTDTYVGSLTPAFTSYVDGADYRVRFPAANTVPGPTLNLNGIGAKTLVTRSGGSLVAGAIRVGSEHVVRYVAATDKLNLVSSPNTQPVLLISGSTGGYTNILEFKNLIDGTYSDYVIRLRRFKNNTGVACNLILSTNNGVSYYSTQYRTFYTSYGAASAPTTSSGGITLTKSGLPTPGDIDGYFDITLIQPSVVAIQAKVLVEGGWLITNATDAVAFSAQGGTSATNNTNAINAAAIMAPSGTGFDTYAEFWGIP